VIRDVAGEPLSGTVVDVREFEMPPEGIPLAELMAHKLTFELEYQTPNSMEFLTFSQRFTDDEGMLPSEMKLVLMQENAPEAELHELRPGDVEIVRFDWDLPPLSPEASAEEREKWMAKQKEETLGITSYSSVYSFLYIDDYEVRHEILIPILTLEQSVLIARDDDDFLDLNEQDAARKQIEAYFCAGNPIKIDGTETQPQVQRCDFYGLNFKDFAMQAEPKSVPIASARVGIILSYPATTTPQSVELTWNRFNSYVWTVNTVVFAFDKTRKVTLTRLGNNNVFAWENPGRPAAPDVEAVVAKIPAQPSVALPLASLGCVIGGLAVCGVMRVFAAGRRVYVVTAAITLLAAALAWPWAWAQHTIANPFAPRYQLTAAEADAVFAALQANMYRAFKFREESAIYDALALCIHGDLLRDVYLQIRQGLQMQEQGGAISRIRKVEILEGQHVPLRGKVDENQYGFRYRCRWNVSGTVEHWGHVHQRTNQYEAAFYIQTVDSRWKVTNMELLAEERLKFETRLRGL
jgi:hypothetical protein